VEFVNVSDSTQGLSDFSQFPAINNRGAVAFVARKKDTTQAVFKSEHNGLKEIASTSSTTGNPFTFFTDDVVINAAGVVGFRSLVTSGPRAEGIFTGDGLTTTTIIDSTVQGLPGPGIGSPSINASGTVAFQAFRNGFRSSLIFSGNGGPLTTVLDTLNSNFGTFGVVAINAPGEIVFRAILKDRNEGIFVAKQQHAASEDGNGSSGGTFRVTDIVDSTNPDFFGFGDPVINDAGVVADFAGVPLGLEIISGNGRGVTARTDPSTGFFADMEHPSINSHGAVAFSALEADGGQGVFAELTGGDSTVTVLQTGDPLFGSRVTGVSVGRFAFNDGFRLAFSYQLEDGRSGIAVARLRADGADGGDTSAANAANTTNDAGQ